MTGGSPCEIDPEPRTPNDKGSSESESRGGSTVGWEERAERKKTVGCGMVE